MHEGGNSQKWLRREWRGDGRRCLSPYSRCCLWHECRTLSSLYMLCSCSKSGPERGTFPLGKAALLLLDTQAANMPPSRKALAFWMFKPAILLGNGPLLAEGGGCQMGIVYCDFKNLLEGRWFPFAEIGVCCPGKTPNVFTAALQGLCVW